MFGRTNKNSPWIGTLSYNFTKPVSKTKGISNPLKVALLFADGNTMKSRKLILKAIGEPRWEAKGQLACLFTALNWNAVIHYDKEQKCYIKGRRFNEYMEYTLKEMNQLHLQTKHKKEYLTVLKEISNTFHFIMEG